MKTVKGFIGDKCSITHGKGVPVSLKMVIVA